MIDRSSGLAVLLVLFLGGCGSTIRGSFQRAPQVSGPVELEVQTRSGDITVRSGPPGSVSIVGRISARSSFLTTASESDVRELERNPPLRQQGNLLVLERTTYDDVAIDYEITVPPDSTLRADTGSGDCRTRGVQRGVAIRTGSGDVEVDDVGGGVHVTTGSGNIGGHRVAGSLEARTGSGDIRIELTGSGNVTASTGSGNAELLGVSGGLAIRTGSGDVVAQGEPRAGWRVRTSSGDVHVRLPTSVSFELDVSTGSGNITLGRPVQTTVQGRVDDDRSHVAGRVGSGGPLVEVRTGSGDVQVD